MGLLLACDDPHPRRPAGQVQQAGELGDPRPLADGTAGIDRRAPHIRGDLGEQLGSLAGQGEADGVGQAPPVHPPQHGVGAAGVVRADQHPPSGPGAGDMSGQLGQRALDHGDVVGGGVGPGIARAQQDAQRLPGAFRAVVDERAQRVEPIPALERRTRVLLVRVSRDQRRVQVHDQRVLRADPVVRGAGAGGGPRVRPGRGPRGIDGGQCRRGRLGQGGDRARDRRVGGHQPVDVRLGAQQRGVVQVPPADRQRDRQVEEHLRGVVHRERPAPRRQRGGQLPPETGRHDRLRQQHPAGLTHRPRGGDIDPGARVEPGSLLHLGSAPHRETIMALSKPHRSRSGALSVATPRPQTDPIPLPGEIPRLVA